MFFYRSDIDHSLIREFELDKRTGRQTFLRELAEDLQRYPQDYQLFGPYWWYIKEQFRLEGVARKAWFYHSPGDNRVLEPLLAEGPANILAAALQYLRMMQEEPQPLLTGELENHLWEMDGEAELRRIEDPGYNRQPDLFAEVEQSEQQKRQFLNMPDNYIPRIWKEKGNLRLEEGRPFAAYRCFQRYLSSAIDDQSRADAWLLIGLLFHKLGHFPKAIFAFSNAYDRDTQDWILAHLAEARVANGDIREGLSLYEQLVRAMPGNPEYRGRLEALKIEAQKPVDLEEVGELAFYPVKRSIG